jgi:HSP20 family protein
MLPTIRYRPARALRQWELPELNRWFDEVLNRPLEAWPSWTPSADLFETADGFELELEVPGFEKDAIDVTVERGILIVSGQHTLEEEDSGRTYHCRERSFERFTRTFSLPHTVNPEHVDAELENGVLYVRLPKMEEAKPRKIAVAVK